MQFGTVDVASAKGAILAHSVQAGSARLRKGVTLTAGHVAQLHAAGIAQVTVARLEAGDIHEDAAAEALASALVANTAALRIGPAGTGRCNIFATEPGLAQIDGGAINEANAVHPMITVATVPQHRRLGAGGMLATVKIIAYGVPEAALTQACAAGHSALTFATAQLKTASFIETTLDTTVNSKGADVIAARVTALGATLGPVTHSTHRVEALAQALQDATGDIILILTASATSDPHDTAPEALRRAGGTLTHFGMPVDPGNLLFIGTLGARPVIGLPGCARSPALNGADWVLERLICGVPVTAQDIMGMGVGGLLKEIPTRPQPRKPVSP